MQAPNTRVPPFPRRLLAVALMGFWSLGIAQAPPKVGQPAPALKLMGLDGKPIDLAALKGKVVVVNFWATWCGPCRKEMPALNAYYRSHKARGLEVLGVSIDDDSALPEVGKVMAALSFPAALLSKAQENGFGSPVAVPFTYVVDAQGVIRGRIPPGGEGLTAQRLAREVGPLLPPAVH